MNPNCRNVIFTENIVCSLETFLQIFFSKNLLRVREMPIFWRTHFAYDSKNLDLRMCTDILLLNEFLSTISSSLFPLANATIAMFAKDVPMVPIKYFEKIFLKQISEIYF